MTVQREVALQSLGFRFGINGPHAARTMMLEEVRMLFSHIAPNAERSDFVEAIVEHNVLGKPTRKARELSLRYLTALYSLDNKNPIYRALRRLWPLNEAAQPLLALAVALARDPLLKSTQEFVLGQPVGSSLTREAFEQLLSEIYPERFTAASLRSFAQNVAGSWTAGQVLVGHRNKVRTSLVLHPEAITMLLFLGYLEGRTGQRLFSSDWTSLGASSADDLEAQANSASHRGLLVFMNAGGIKEVRFPGYLSAEEESIRQELCRVI